MTSRSDDDKNEHGDLDHRALDVHVPTSVI